MITTSHRGSPLALLLVLVVSLLPQIQAENITIRIQLGDRTASLPGYDSTGVVFVSIRHYAAALAYPWVNNLERRKIEVRLPGQRVKASAGNPFLVVTDVSTSTSSVVQLSNDVMYIDSLYFAPASEFIALLERFSASGAKLDNGTRMISKQPVPANPQFDITGLSLESRSNGYLLNIKSSRKLGDYSANLASDGWVYVTVDDARADTIALGKYKTNDIVRRVLVFQYPTSVQLTFQVSPEIVQVDPQIDSQTQNLMLALHTKSAVEKAQVERRQQDEVRGRLQDERSRAKLDVVVLDAGHGGKDPGTIGVAGTHEKDVALGVTLKLGKLIEKNLPDVKVVYTRTNDTFVELDQRAQIANDAGGKLFISIHCNSTERKPSSANGFEIYLLRPNKTESAVEIAARENNVINLEKNPHRYQELTEEYFILLTMRQSAYVKHSEDFAEVASETTARQLKIQNSGVKQAGFYVLVGASMPKVLVETGYLSNRQEERVLRSADGQRKIAEALFEGIKEYKTKYEEALRERRTSEPGNE